METADAPPFEALFARILANGDVIHDLRAWVRDRSPDELVATLGGINIQGLCNPPLTLTRLSLLQLIILKTTGGAAMLLSSESTAARASLWSVDASVSPAEQQRLAAAILLRLTQDDPAHGRAQPPPTSALGTFLEEVLEHLTTAETVVGCLDF